MSVDSLQSKAALSSISDDEISLLDLVFVLVRHKKKIIALPVLAGLIAAMIALSLPNQYTATLKIAPSKNAPAYNWVLSNDLVREQVAKDLNLAAHFSTQGRQATRTELSRAMKVTLNAKDGFLDVNVTDADPEFAAKLVNRMGAALQDNLYGLRLLDISKQRYELETRRELAQKNKSKFDAIIKQADIAATIGQMSAADRYGVTSLAAIQAESTLQSSKSDNESGGIGSIDMMQNELVRVHSQLASLQRIVTEGMSKKIDSSEAGLWIAAVDALQQQSYWAALIERLDRRIELLKTQERDELKMTLAEVPDEKSGPKRAIIVLLAMCVALFVAVLYAFIIESITRSRQRESSSALMNKIADAWRAK